MNKLIIIWGAAIIIYLFVANQSGTSALFSGTSSGITNITKALQGR